jgi:hypothetical protein
MDHLKYSTHERIAYLLQRLELRGNVEADVCHLHRSGNERDRLYLRKPTECSVRSISQISLLHFGFSDKTRARD